MRGYSSPEVMTGFSLFPSSSNTLENIQGGNSSSGAIGADKVALNSTLDPWPLFLPPTVNAVSVVNVSRGQKNLISIPINNSMSNVDWIFPHATWTITNSNITIQVDPFFVTHRILAGSSNSSVGISLYVPSSVALGEYNATFHLAMRSNIEPPFQIANIEFILMIYVTNPSPPSDQERFAIFSPIFLLVSSLPLGMIVLIFTRRLEIDDVDGKTDGIRISKSGGGRRRGIIKLLLIMLNTAFSSLKDNFKHLFSVVRMT